jgi:hypothetical protein
LLFYLTLDNKEQPPRRGLRSCYLLISGLSSLDEDSLMERLCEELDVKKATLLSFEGLLESLVSLDDGLFVGRIVIR